MPRNLNKNVYVKAQIDWPKKRLIYKKRCPQAIHFPCVIDIHRGYLCSELSFQIGKKAADSADPHIFDMSAQIFGRIPTAPESNASVEMAEEVGNEKDEDTQSDSESSERSLLTALASATIAESPWRNAPSYPTLYLSTVGEYLPPQAKLKVPKGIQVSELGDDEKKDKDISWATETYENSLEMDHVFERFTKRIGCEGKQCVRSATNLSYSMTNWIILIDTSWGVHHYHSLRTRLLIYYGQCLAKSPCL
jgi:hypothetical protein